MPTSSSSPQDHAKPKAKKPKAAPFAQLQTELDALPVDTLLERMDEAVNSERWERKHQLLGSTISLHAVNDATRAPEIRELAKDGGVPRVDIMRWIRESPKYGPWVEQMNSKMEAKSYQNTITKALLKAGNVRTGTGGRYIKWILPDVKLNPKSESPKDPPSEKAAEREQQEGNDDKDFYIIQRGSMVVEKEIGGNPVFLSYLPAGSYVGEMAVIDGSKRTATVKAAIKGQVIRFPGEAFGRLLDAKPALRERILKDMAGRREINRFIEAQKQGFSGAVDMYSQTAQFLVDNGLGEATDVLLIDEKLCVGCDNCEKACADSHEGLSRLDREAGKTYAHLHVPTSCRHCEHPHCMADCPPNAIKRGPDGEVFIDDTCIGCGNCQRNCPYGVIRLDAKPPPKPSLFSWLMFGAGPGPGEAPYKWRKKRADKEAPKVAIKCDMCSGIEGGPACVRACPTGAAIRVAPEKFLTFTKLTEEAD